APRVVGGGIASFPQKPAACVRRLTYRAPPAGLVTLSDKKTGMATMRGTFAGSESAGRIGRPWSTQHDSSDQALIEKGASGNRLAMQVLFARHHARVYHFVLRLIGNDAVAEDVTSEVFLVLWRQAHRF